MKYAEFFITKCTPYSKQKCVCVKSPAPTELVDFMMQLHLSLGCDELNDWIYEIAREAFYEMEYNHECTVDYEPSDKELIKWMQNVYAVAFCKESLELGHGKGNDILEVIRFGQWAAKMYIYERINEFIKETKCQQEN